MSPNPGAPPTDASAASGGAIASGPTGGNGPSVGGTPAGNRPGSNQHIGNKPPQKIERISAGVAQSNGKTDASAPQQTTGVSDEPAGAPRPVSGTSAAPALTELPDPAELDSLPAKRRAVVIEYFRERHGEVAAPAPDSNSGGNP
jgi:hypothetical protein